MKLDIRYFYLNNAIISFAILCLCCYDFTIKILRCFWISLKLIFVTFLFFKKFVVLIYQSIV